MASLRWITLLVLTGLALGQDCNFDGKMTEDPRCGWSNDITDDFEWTVTRFPTRTPFTGPSGDHTVGMGNYVYAEANDAGQGQKARLYSPYDTPANSEDNTLTELVFWYSMWEDFPVPQNPEMGTLNVYIEFAGKVPTGQPIWSHTGKESNEWVEGKILFRAPEPFRIIFEAVRGSGERSDIGIDDIVVIQTEIPTTCDFEDSDLGDLCIFMQNMDDDFDWTRNAGETPSLDTGPPNDHTLGTDMGHYLFIETTREDAVATATITSYPYFRYATGSCELRFFYHAYGANVGQLTATIDHDSGDVVSMDVVDGDSEDAWKLATLSVPDAQGLYTVSFTGTRPVGGNLGDIAIDDVSLEGDCYAVDYCMSYPCQNGGECSTSLLGFECVCVIGWTGSDCAENIDDCQQGSCSGNFECVDLVNDFECVCPEGYGGENCEPYHPPTVPGPVDGGVDGINPETIPIIIGSCVGAFILVVTAAWFTATCIKNDGYQRGDSDAKDSKDAEVGGQASMYVNNAYEPEHDLAPGGTKDGDKDYEEVKPKSKVETKDAGCENVYDNTDVKKDVPSTVL